MYPGPCAQCGCSPWLVDVLHSRRCYLGCCNHPLGSFELLLVSKTYRLGTLLINHQATAHNEDNQESQA